jgi:hypothetical protein
MRIRNRELALCAFLAASVVLGGCGGGGGGDEHGAKANPKAQFVRKAGGICLEGNVRISNGIHDTLRHLYRVDPNHPGTATNADIARFAKTLVVPEVQKELDQLRRLGPAPGAKHRLKALIAREQAALNAVRKDPTHYAVESGADPFRTSRLSPAYGLTYCGFGQ